VKVALPSIELLVWDEKPVKVLVWPGLFPSIVLIVALWVRCFISSRPCNCIVLLGPLLWAFCSCLGNPSLWLKVCLIGVCSSVLWLLIWAASMVLLCMVIPAGAGGVSALHALGGSMPLAAARGGWQCLSYCLSALSQL
jgi:hypothetical protein